MKYRVISRGLFFEELELPFFGQHHIPDNTYYDTRTFKEVLSPMEEQMIRDRKYIENNGYAA